MDNEKETKKNKKIKLSTIIIGLALVAALGGGIWWTFIGSKPQGPDLVEPEKEAITQESFEELPVGLIYEFSEEEQQAFLELAKKNYEEYGDKAPDMWGVFNSDEFFYEERWGITRKNNTNPTEMLNEDGSLRYPDGFYGFVVSNRDYNLQAQENVRQNYELITDADINAKVNQMLNVEQYYLVQNTQWFGYFHLSSPLRHNYLPLRIGFLLQFEFDLLRLYLLLVARLQFQWIHQYKNIRIEQEVIP